MVRQFKCGGKPGVGSGIVANAAPNIAPAKIDRQMF